MARAFDYSLPFRSIDFRERPELYRVGRGEQGVLLVQPYKDELLPLWRFRTPAIARVSARALYHRFVEYGRAGDFVGMDMARKLLQMGFTRARRYANHPGGRKYDGPVPRAARGRSGSHGRPQLPRRDDAIKAAAAEVFRTAWQRALANPTYRRLRRAFDVAVAAAAAPPAGGRAPGRRRPRAGSRAQ